MVRPARAETFDATAALAERADSAFAQFVMLTPFPGTVEGIDQLATVGTAAAKSSSPRKRA